jgi:hypothetical protein
MATAGLLFSVPFLILSRQCRYYSLTAFFSLGGLYGYHAMIRKKRFGSYIYFIASTFLFHTHYIYLAALLGTVALHTLLFHRNQWKNVLLWSFGILLVNAPWILWFSNMRYVDQYGTGKFSWDPFISQLSFFLSSIRQHVFPVSLLMVPLGMVFWKWFRNKTIFLNKDPALWNNISIPLFFVLTNLFVLSLVAPAPFFRYVAPVLPFLAMVIGLFLGWAMQIHLLVGTGILVCLVLSGPFHGFLYEITHDYDGPIEGIVGYLNEHAKRSDIVAITYGDLPVKFYAGLRVVGGLTGEDLTPAVEANWVIIRRNVICEKDHKVWEFLTSRINWQNYKKIVLDYPDSPCENRESPRHHLYRTKANYPPVILFQKVK